MPQFDKAKVIVALDCGFPGARFADAVLPTKQFSKGRKFSSEEDLEKVNRLYAVESQFSLTGANADHRLRMRSGEVKQFAMDLAAALGAVPGLNVVQGGSDKRAKFLAAVVKDLKAAGPGALVVAGARQPAIVHAIAAAINQSLGSAAVSYVKPERQGRFGHRRAEGADQRDVVGAGSDAGDSGRQSGVHGSGGSAIRRRAGQSREFDSSGSRRRRNGGGCEVACAGSAFPRKLERRAHRRRSGRDSAAADLASVRRKDGGGDRRAADRREGQEGLRHRQELLAGAVAGERQGRRLGARRLNDGIVASAKPADAAKVSVDAKKLAGAAGAEAKTSATGIEVAFYPSASAWDGRFANNGWMQEAPDPMTKLTWGNAAMISPATAREQKLEDGDMIAISRGNYKLEAAVMVQPGHADNAVSIALGYGRARCGRVGKDVGFNANLIRTSDAFWFGDGFHDRLDRQ